MKLVIHVEKLVVDAGLELGADRAALARALQAQLEPLLADRAVHQSSAAPASDPKQAMARGLAGAIKPVLGARKVQP